MSEDKPGIKLCYPCSHHREKNTAQPMLSGTGACGIDCNVCRLHVMGVCSHCGSGVSQSGRAKLEAQHRLFGMGCPILECASQRKIAYCLRDCSEFPCDRFSSDRGNYPYSKGFLEMQTRRREQAESRPVASWPDTAEQFWNMLDEKVPAEVVASSCATLTSQGDYELLCLGERWLIEPKKRQVTKIQGSFGGEWDRQVPFLLLVYLVHAQDGNLSGEMTTIRDLFVGVNVFQSHLAVETTDFESTFGTDGEAFKNAATSLGGQATSNADVSYRFQLLPKFPVEFLLWLADEEFEARVSVLLDRSIPHHMPVDGVATLLNLLIQRLLLESRPPTD